VGPTCAERIGRYLGQGSTARFGVANCEIDRRLRIDPFLVGESRENSSIRFAVVESIGVQFKVIVDDAKVQVLNVFEVGRPSG
jgi:hypothetical protein